MKNKSRKQPITIYYLSDELKEQIREKGLLEQDLTISQLLQILSVKFLLNEIKLDSQDRKLLQYES